MKCEVVECCQDYVCDELDLSDQCQEESLETYCSGCPDRDQANAILVYETHGEVRSLFSRSSNEESERIESDNQADTTEVRLTKKRTARRLRYTKADRSL